MNWDLNIYRLGMRFREFCRKEVVPFADQWEREQTFPLETIRKMGELGFFTLPFPEKYGGTNLGFLANAIVAEELGRASLGLACCLNMQTWYLPNDDIPQWK